MEKIFVIVLLTFMAPFQVDDAWGYRSDRDHILFVEEGDSYLKLFGPDWQKVYRTNKDHLTYNRPERLVVGERLAVPAGTTLTQTALERLNRYEDFRRAALGAIREAEDLSRRTRHYPAAVYEEGAALLAKAERTFAGSGLADYAQARRDAQEAVRNFGLCSEVSAGLGRAEQNVRKLEDQLHQAGQNTAKLEDLLRRKDSVVHSSHSRFIADPYRTVFTGLLFLALSGLACGLPLRMYRKKKQALRVETWLRQHRDRAARLNQVKL